MNQGTAKKAKHGNGCITDLVAKNTAHTEGIVVVNIGVLNIGQGGGARSSPVKSRLR